MEGRAFPGSMWRVERFQALYVEGRAFPGSMWRVERGNEAILGCLFHPYAQSKIGTWNKAALTVLSRASAHPHVSAHPPIFIVIYCLGGFSV